MQRALVIAMLVLALTGNALAQARQAIARFNYHPDGSISISVLDPNGQKPLPVEWLKLAAIGDQYERGRTIEGSVTASDASHYKGTLGLPDGSWNLDIRAKLGAQELEGNWLINSDAISNGDVPLIVPNTGEVNRMSRIVGFGLLAIVAVAVLAVAWGLLAQRRARDEEDEAASRL